ncbi:hypothetical protein P691DRAFT_788471 [Macrolepiota fuliginosa MF-IS2]|uniref:Uncharacterized protein n=1 Tax=Macrolepiota fuliginosa MF-IS2 TaxID=1400762 RepID=A0A9P6C735_9AGAR|nr:hypothetical protein P691DRAFT_788471 [Macrolepiota fuliginosa MF-IS2]
MPPVCDCLQTFLLYITALICKMLSYLRHDQGNSATSDIELGSGAPIIMTTSALGNLTLASHREADIHQTTLATRNPGHRIPTGALQRHATSQSPTTEATNLIGDRSDSPTSTDSDHSSIGNTSIEAQSLDSSMTSIGVEDEGRSLQDESVEDREQVIVDMKDKFDGATAVVPLLDRKVKELSIVRDESDWRRLLSACVGKVTDIKDEGEEGGAKGKVADARVNDGRHDDEVYEDDPIVPAHRGLKLAIEEVEGEEEGEDWSNSRDNLIPHVTDPEAVRIDPSGPTIVIESPTFDQTFYSMLEATEDFVVLMDSMVNSAEDPDSGTGRMGDELSPGVISCTPFDLGYDWFGGAVEEYYRAKTEVYSENANADLLFDDPFSDYYAVGGSGYCGYDGHIGRSPDIVPTQALQRQSVPLNKLTMNAC